MIGPEAPLVDGLADRLRADGRLVFGPGADGARLEGSKAFMKELLAEAGVPTARYGAFDDPAEAREFCRSLPGPWVVKTDGLAAGKGVLVTGSLARGRGGHRGQAVRRRLRGGRATGGGRGGVDRAGVLAAGALRRRAPGPAGAGPGLQAPRRPRPWPQHRGDGGVLTGPRRRRTGSSPSWSTRRWPRWWRPCGPGPSTTGACSTPASCSRRRGRRCSSSTSASATPRPRWCCPGSRATCSACLPRWRPDRCAPGPASPTGRRCAWCAPRPATRTRRGPGTGSTASMPPPHSVG